MFREIQNLVVLNSEARMEIGDEDHKYCPKGSAVEVGLFEFLLSNEIAVQE